MPRSPRVIVPGLIYHIINRGNGRQTIFHKPADYAAFLKVLADSQKRIPLDILGYCLMPNHWHLVLRPPLSPDLPRFMAWLCTTHVRRHHEHYHIRGGGHLYQGRFKSFVVQDDGHLLNVLRYVEANAFRAGLVERAEHWPFSSAAAQESHLSLKLASWPLDRPHNWLELLNEPVDEPELAALRQSVQRGKPYGQKPWVQEVVRVLGLDCTLRPRGRPRKEKQTAAETVIEG